MFRHNRHCLQKGFYKEKFIFLNFAKPEIVCAHTRGRRWTALLLFAACLTIPLGLRAEENRCNPKSTSDLVNCTLLYHPELQIMYAERRREAARKGLASQIPNPQFDARLLYGNDGYSAELDLQHTFELGGKRGARIQRAKRQLSVFERKLLLKKQRVLMDLLSALHRMRQLRHEIGLLKEASRTYASVRWRFRRLPHLNPDQELSSNIYLFAISENRQHIRVLKNEYRLLEQKVRLYAGSPDLKLEPLLPKSLARWPRLLHRPVTESPFLELAQSRIALGKSELELQDSLAWPNFSIGPSLDYSRQKNELPAYLGGGKSRSRADVGASFSFTLPLYHRNTGGRKLAQREVEVEKTRHQVLKSRLNLLRKSLVNIYRESVKTLDIQAMRRVLQAKHRRLHQLLRRGIVHSSLVIELHRQELEFVQATHKNEMEALMTLFRVRAIDGKMFPDRIKNESSRTKPQHDNTQTKSGQKNNARTPNNAAQDAQEENDAK